MKAEQRLFREALDHIGKNWAKGKLTRGKLIQNVRHITRSMARQGIQHIGHMKTKHMDRFFDELKARGLAPSTLQNYATACRDLAASIGKPSLISGKNADLGITRHDRYQPIHANHAKLASIREQLSIRDERLLAAYDLREAFGLRSKESLLSREVVERDGKAFLKVEGAKGGRPRLVEIETDQQRRAIEQVQHIIEESGTKSLIPRDMDLKTFYDYQRNTISALGVRRADGSNMHAQRHDFAQREVGKGKASGEVQDKLGHGKQRTLRHYVP